MDYVRFLNEEIYPALFERLDYCFPEFGWKKKGSGWVATNKEFCSSKFNCRHDRVVSNQNFGYMIYGAEGKQRSWVSYVSGIDNPRGKSWFDAIKILCKKTGIDLPINDEKKEDIFQSIYEDFIKFSHFELLKSEQAKNYLIGERGFSKDILDDEYEFGYFADSEIIFAKDKNIKYKKGDLKNPILNQLLDKYSEEDLEKTNIFYDSRWSKRILGPWRDRNKLINIWSRIISKEEKPHEKYLFLTGGHKKSPFNISNLNNKHVYIIEGVLDVFRLRINGINNVVATGGASLGIDQLKELKRAGVDKVTFFFDHDPDKNNKGAGYIGMINTIKNTSKFPLNISAIDLNKIFEGHQEKIDTDSLILTQGIDEWLGIMDTAIPSSELYCNFVMNNYPEDLARKHIKEYLTFYYSENTFEEINHIDVEFSKKFSCPKGMISNEIGFNILDSLDDENKKGLLKISRKTQKSTIETIVDILKKSTLGH